MVGGLANLTLRRVGGVVKRLGFRLEILFELWRVAEILNAKPR